MSVQGEENKKWKNTPEEQICLPVKANPKWVINDFQINLWRTVWVKFSADILKKGVCGRRLYSRADGFDASYFGPWTANAVKLVSQEELAGFYTLYNTIIWGKIFQVINYTWKLRIFMSLWVWNIYNKHHQSTLGLFFLLKKKKVSYLEATWKLRFREIKCSKNYTERKKQALWCGTPTAHSISTTSSHSMSSYFKCHHWERQPTLYMLRMIPRLSYTSNNDLGSNAC